jgi:hypothetical protein
MNTRAYTRRSGNTHKRVQQQCCTMERLHAPTCPRGPEPPGLGSLIEPPVPPHRVSYPPPALRLLHLPCGVVAGEARCSAPPCVSPAPPPATPGRERREVLDRNDGRLSAATVARHNLADPRVKARLSSRLRLVAAERFGLIERLQGGLRCRVPGPRRGPSLLRRRRREPSRRLG